MCARARGRGSLRETYTRDRIEACTSVFYGELFSLSLALATLYSDEIVRFPRAAWIIGVIRNIVILSVAGRLCLCVSKFCRISRVSRLFKIAAFTQACGFTSLRFVWECVWYRNISLYHEDWGIYSNNEINKFSFLFSLIVPLTSLTEYLQSIIRLLSLSLMVCSNTNINRADLFIGQSIRALTWFIWLIKFVIW